MEKITSIIAAGLVSLLVGLTGAYLFAEDQVPNQIVERLVQLTDALKNPKAESVNIGEKLRQLKNGVGPVASHKGSTVWADVKGCVPVAFRVLDANGREKPVIRITNFNGELPPPTAQTLWPPESVEKVDWCALPPIKVGIRTCTDWDCRQTECCEVCWQTCL
jgi:hypothetical protein